MKANNVPYLTPTYEAILSACIKLKDITRVYVATTHSGART